MSCRGQSAAAADGRHDSGKRAHLHRWEYRSAAIGTVVIVEAVVFKSVFLLSGRRVGGQTALEMGLVNRAVEQNQSGDAAFREALSLAREILPQVRV